MKNYFLIFVILFLIIVTTITKNSSKKLENQIFSVKENISVLKNIHELVLLDFNFLTSPKKLLEYQSKYFENDLVSLDINKIKKIKEKLKKFKENRNEKVLQKALNTLKSTLDTNDNIMSDVVACVESNATLGEISDILRKKFGEYQG